MLDDVIKTTNRRVNALEYVLLPKLDNTINYIGAELDEQDREEFFRLKKIQGKKKKEKTEAEELAIDENYDLDMASNNLLMEDVYDPDIIV